MCLECSGSVWVVVAVGSGVLARALWSHGERACEILGSARSVLAHP